MLKGVIFDMDGVIVNSHPIHVQAWRRLLESAGRSVTPRDLEFVLDGRRREEILRHFFGDLAEDELRAYGGQKEHLFRQEAESLKPIEGLVQFLDSLQRESVLLAVASSASHERVHDTLVRLLLLDRFKTVVTGDDVPRGKPDPAVFQHAAVGLNCRPAEVVVIEDAVSGVQAAKSAGMRCIAIAGNGRTDLLRRAGADEVFPNFLGLSAEHVRGIVNRPSAPAVSPPQRVRRRESDLAT